MNKRILIIITMVACCIDFISKAISGEQSEPGNIAEEKKGDVLWFSVPDILNDVSFSFSRYYIVPAISDRPEKIVNEIEILGSIGERRGYIRIGIFDSEADAKNGCAWLFSDCAAAATPIIVEFGKRIVTIGDESWDLDSSIVFLKGRMLCTVDIYHALSYDDKLNLARAVANSILFHPSPHVLVASAGQPPTMANASGHPPSIRLTKVRKAAVLPKIQQSHQMWLGDLLIVGIENAEWFCFELQKGCLIYSRTIVATKGVVQVWGKSAEARYLGESGKVMMRPAVGVGDKVRWGEIYESFMGKEQTNEHKNR